MAIIPSERRSLLSSQARVQAPFIKVTIGSYTFGVFSRNIKSDNKDQQGFYTSWNIQYPNYVQRLQITKINGQVNQYTLSINYPVRHTDDPNFFEKVFSAVSKIRKIVFSYGDSSMPSYIYKDEEAIITSVKPSFSFGDSGTMNAVIGYTVTAVSGAALGKAGSFNFIQSAKKKPSDEIKRIILDKRYGLRDLFSGINETNINKLIDGSDQYVTLQAKINISALDYITYLASCMIPIGNNASDRSKDIYVLTIHDDTSYDRVYADREIIDGKEIIGPYLKVTRMSYLTKQSDAYEIDIGYNSSTIVTSFTVDNNDTYALYYDYDAKLQPEEYVRRLNDKGEFEDIYSPAFTSRNSVFETRPEDINWYTKLTKFPTTASITIQGLLRPAMLMTYVRLNVIFPGGHKHISSGLYIVTKQVDTIDGSGYRTQLSLTKIDGDYSLEMKK